VGEEVEAHKREVIAAVRTAQLVDALVDDGAQSSALVRMQTDLVGLDGLAVQPPEDAVAIE
jgi:hypothetical protein